LIILTVLTRASIVGDFRGLVLSDPY